MKKVVLLVLSIVLSIVLIGQTVLLALAINAPTITCVDKECYPGDTITVDANISNNPGIAALRLTPDYSSELGTPTISDYGVVFKKSDLEVGKNYFWSTDSDVTTNGKLIQLTFNVPTDIAIGNYSVSYKFREANNADEDDVTFTVVAATISVVEKPCGHTSKTPVAAKDSTCLVQGWDAYSKCDSCGKLFNANGNEISEIPYRALSGHNYVNTVDEKYLASGADCNATAKYYKSCSVCGAKSTETFESGSALGHNYTNETVDSKYLKSAADCTHAAVYYKSCSRCGLASTTETFESGTSLGHNFVNTVDDKYFASGATCTTPAKYYKSCSRCHEKSTETFEYGTALGHNYIENSDAKFLKSAADCTTPAVYYKSCSVCGEKSTETFTGTALGHDYTNKVDSKYLKSAADCTHKAVYYKSCSRCGAQSTETFEYGEFDPTNHIGTTHVVPAEASTCIHQGHGAYTVCDECNSIIFGSNEAFPLDGHTYVEKAEAKYLVSVATCNKKAVYYKSCSVCGEKSTETFESGSALGHDFIEKQDAKYLKSAADCTTPAVYYKSCSRCGEKSSETFKGAALGHDYAWKYSEDAHWKECTRCHDVDGTSEEHTFQYVRTVEPTTTKEGLEEETCKVCGYKTGKTKTIEKLPVTEVIYDAPKSVVFTEAGNFEGGTVVIVKEVEEKATIEIVKKALDGVVKESKMAVLDFTAIKDGVKVQPTGKVKVTIDIPENLSADNLAMFYISDDGVKQKLSITVDKKNRKVTTELEHFSTYVLANVNSSPKDSDNDVFFLITALLAVMSTSVLVGVGYRKKRSNI